MTGLGSKVESKCFKQLSIIFEYFPDPRLKHTSDPFKDPSSTAHFSFSFTMHAIRTTSVTDFFSSSPSVYSSFDFVQVWLKLLACEVSSGV